MNRLTREQAIETVRVEAVELVEKRDLWYTDCVLDAYTKFACSIDCKNGEVLTMYVTVDADEVHSAEQLDNLDWTSAIRDAEFKIEG